MNFREAFVKMLEGHAVRRPSWSGYWAWEEGTIKMYLRNGEVLDIRNMTSVAETILNIISDDWETCRKKVEDPSSRKGIFAPRMKFD